MGGNKTSPTYIIKIRQSWDPFAPRGFSDWSWLLKISNNERLIYAPQIEYVWFNKWNDMFSPSCSNETSSCSCDWNDIIKVSHADQYFWNSASFLSFFALTILLTLFLKKQFHFTFNSQHPITLVGLTFPAGPIDLWWKHWLITREQEQIRPLRYWWFIIHFWGVNGEPYLNCSCLIYTFCSCIKSSAVVGFREGVLMEGRVRLGYLPRTRLCFGVFLALWSDLDI